jgi:eukaryotic-like serine/threonine-protein kinase
MSFADRFVFGERVGMGATGEVLRAFDKHRGSEVAVKRLHDHLVADPFSRERFRCETALSARINSEHVVRCFDGGVDDDDRPYLVLEWLDGQDLAAQLKSSRVSVAEAIEITRQTALGLQAMHDAGIVHRDVKPRNLFVARGIADKPFVVKLLDLGVASDAGADRGESVSLGTPFYMSPEQAQASGSIGPATDLFSLGALFFELLTGRRPFMGPTTFSLLSKIALQETPRLSAVWPEAPPALERFLLRALAREPTHRFVSAREMADELGRLAMPDVEGPLAPELAGPLSYEPNSDHLVAAIFGRLPLSSNVGRARDLFRHIVRTYQGWIVTLLGRGVVAVFEGECADAALRAADAVLELTENIGGARWSLATGGMLPSEAGLSESLIDRGNRALERARTSPDEACVRVDDETARLLEEHYVIEGAAGSYSLRAVRPTNSIKL